MIHAIDLPALQSGLRRPVKFRQTTVERHAIFTAVELAATAKRLHLRNGIRNLRRANEIALAHLDAIDAEIRRSEINQTLAAELRFVATGRTISARRCLVADIERDLHVDRRQRVDFDTHRVRCIFGERSAIGDHQRQRLADVTLLVVRDHRLQHMIEAALRFGAH